MFADKNPNKGSVRGSVADEFTKTDLQLDCVNLLTKRISEYDINIRLIIPRVTASKLCSADHLAAAKLTRIYLKNNESDKRLYGIY